MFKPTQHPLTYLHLTLLNYQIPEFPPLPYDRNPPGQRALIPTASTVLRDHSLAPDTVNNFPFLTTVFLSASKAGLFPFS